MAAYSRSPIAMRRAFAALLVLASAVSTATAETTLNIGKADAVASPILPVNVGDRLGIFAKHGLTLKIADFTGGGKVSQAMAAGSIDIGIGAGTEMAFIVKGSPALAICEAASPIPYIGIAVPWDSPIHTVEQLKGTKIGVSTAGSFTDWLARQLARHQHWDPTDVTPVPIGNGGATSIAAFRTHAIDATIVSTANIFNWEEKKEGRLLISVSDYVGNIASGTIYASKALIASNPDAVRAFLAAWLETIDHIAANKAETLKIESEITGYSETVTAREYDLATPMFSRDCRFHADSIANLQQSFVELKMFDTPPDLSAAYTEAFLPR